MTPDEFSELADEAAVTADMALAAIQGNRLEELEEHIADLADMTVIVIDWICRNGMRPQRWKLCRLVGSSTERVTQPILNRLSRLADELSRDARGRHKRFTPRAEEFALLYAELDSKMSNGAQVIFSSQVATSPEELSIEAALSSSSSVTEAARLLGIPRSTLRDYVKKRRAGTTPRPRMSDVVSVDEVISALEATPSVSAAARRLGWPRSTLRDFMKRHHIVSQ